jgi:hypothetical protein
VHYLSAKATTAYEDARGKVARFINAASDREIVFTRNASEAINLVAQTWGMDNIKQGDEVGAGGAAGNSSRSFSCSRNRNMSSHHIRQQKQKQAAEEMALIAAAGMCQG